MRPSKSMRPYCSRLIVVSLLAAVAVGVCWNRAGAESKRTDAARRKSLAVEPTAFFQAGLRPSLEGGKGWINSGPITLQELRGKIVLLDFWTYCCINCHHVLPDLAKLEQKYKNELVVIGVHTPKFYAEHDIENIRKKVHEYQIKHPVVNDEDQTIWNNFGVSSWPTLVLIDATGRVAAAAPGEGHYEALDKAIAQLVARHRARGELNTTELKFAPESEKPDRSPLSFPGKVVADQKGKRLFIADTAHNRIVLTGLEGEKPVTIGDGVAGLVDGSYGKAEFNRPQGMYLLGETLYVADTENHAIRAIDLKAKKVTTVAGTGQQSHRHSGSGPAKKTGLNSPWDIVLIPGTQTLAIAMAGIHEIWRYDIPSETVGVWAGTGVENINDPELPAPTIANATFAQPSGLTTDGKTIYVADSEVSALRAITSERKPHVYTIVGMGLFVFGDIDGTGDQVRLQHCLGVAFGNGMLYIADTYNNKIKVCDPKKKQVDTLVGDRDRAHGDSDNPPKFYQPGGLSVAGHRLYVADTNNGLIRVIDLKNNAVRTLELEGLSPPAPKARKPVFPRAQITNLGAVKVAPGKALTLEVNLPLESGFKLNADVPMPYLVETPDQSGILAPEIEASGRRLEKPATTFTIDVPLAKSANVGDKFPLKVSVGSFVCNEKSSLCMVKNFVWNASVTVAADGAKSIALQVPEPEK